MVTNPPVPYDYCVSVQFHVSSRFSVKYSGTFGWTFVSSSTEVAETVSLETTLRMFWRDERLALRYTPDKGGSIHCLTFI